MLLRVWFLRLIALVVMALPCGSVAEARADVAAPLPAKASDSAAVLTSIAQIKGSQSDSISRPARIEGVVLWVSDRDDFFLHDGEMGIHVRESAAGRTLKPGERVRVTGRTLQGTFAPSIEPSRIEVLGPGRLPEPQAASFNLVASGATDGQWLEISGVVWSVAFQQEPSPLTVLNLAVDGQHLRVLVNTPLAPDALKLIDAEVKVRGVATGRFNSQHQLVEPVIRVTDLSSITVVRSPPAAAFELPLVPLDRLLAFSLEAPSPHRVRVAGRVTRRISDTTFFLCENTLGLKVELLDPATVKAGDRVEVVGFAAMITGAAVMQSATCRVTSSGPPLPPARLDGRELFSGAYNSNLVDVKARLVDWIRDSQGITLILQSGNYLIKGLLPPTTGIAALPEKNSIVRVTGICVVSDVEDIWLYSPRSVRLLLASLNDVTLLESPPWWTADRLWRALAIALAVLAAGLAWVWSLRRQIRRKAKVIEQQTRHAAALEERSRIARDLHDTLEQGLTGLSLQLKVVEMDLKESPERAAGTLEAARKMLRQSRAFAHDAIRELRTDAVAPHHEDLVAGLRGVVATWQSYGVRGVELRVTGEVRTVTRPIEHALISIASEAMTNAVKHGRASVILIELSFERERLVLAVKDNGTGFEPAESGTRGQGGFGLLGMQERVRALAGRIEFRRRAEGGTEIFVAVPLHQRPTAIAAIVDGPVQPSTAPTAP
jgi:signal transduction histidine kinase